VTGDLDGGVAFFDVKNTKFFGIDEFYGEADLNEINEIRTVRTGFGLPRQISINL
jgi:hypothetical protein